jgi:hypothetical protein
MNSKIQFVYNALWMIQPVLQLGVAGIMLRRKLHKTFPVFFAYIVSQLPIFCLVFSAYKWGNYEEYFYSYWICAAISLVLGFKVIHEVFLDVFRPYHALKDLGSVLFKWAALVMLLIACVVMAASPSAADPVAQAVLTVQRCVRVIQCGLILFLLLFARYLGVSWKQNSFGIALGFGVFAGVELSAVALGLNDHLAQSTLNLVNTAAYESAIVVWFIYACKKSSTSVTTVTLLTSQRWERSLSDLRQPAVSDSLIPMFEGMVDRAFSRTGGNHVLEMKATPTALSKDVYTAVSQIRLASKP